MDATINCQSEPTPDQWQTNQVYPDAGLATEAGQVLQTEAGQDIQQN